MSFELNFLNNYFHVQTKGIGKKDKHFYYSRDLPTQERIVTSPEQYQGLTLQSVCDDKVAWTSQLRGVLASVTATTPQPYVCPLDIPPVEPDTSSSTPPVAGYPFYDSRFSRSRNCPSPGSNSYANTGTTSYNSRARGGRGGHH